jgi:hypothetical protein
MPGLVEQRQPPFEAIANLKQNKLFNEASSKVDIAWVSNCHGQYRDRQPPPEAITNYKQNKFLIKNT